jgi:hypothetical protein
MEMYIKLEDILPIMRLNRSFLILSLVALLFIVSCRGITGNAISDLCGNGIVDEGEVCGSCAKDVAGIEICDNIDNDCDFKVDEGNACNTAERCGSYYGSCLSGSCNFGVCGDPRVLLNLDEGEGTVAHDTSGNGINGTVMNNPRWVSDCKFGGCILFNRDVDYINFSTMPVNKILDDEFTISFWAKAGSNRDRPTFGFQDSSKYLQMNPLASYDRAVVLGDGSSFQQFDYFLPVTFLSSWTHYAFVDNGTSYVIYVDGKKDFVEKIKVHPTGERSFVIGESGFVGSYQDNFNGYIDEFLIYDRGLSSEEVLALYKSGD